MTYVEWQRVRSCVRVCAIIFLAVVALAAILRISVNGYMSSGVWVHNFSMKPETVQTHQTLPDGTKRTILVNPSTATRVVVDDRGPYGKHITITEPSGDHEQHGQPNVGGIDVDTVHRGGMTIKTIDTNGAVSAGIYLALFGFFALVAGTVLAAPLAREIDGHLETTFTKPISRARYALGALAADLAGIVSVGAMAVIAFYCCQLLFQSTRIDVSQLSVERLAMVFLLPFAWYAMLTAFTTWFPRAYGVVLGLGWLFAVVILLVAGTSVGRDNLVLSFIHDAAWVISRAIPLSYASASASAEAQAIIAVPNYATRVLTEALLFVVYGGLAMWRWLRVEA